MQFKEFVETSGGATKVVASITSTVAAK